MFALDKFFSNSLKNRIPIYAHLANPVPEKKDWHILNEIGENYIDVITKINKPYIYFTSEEKIKGDNFLEKLGIRENKFICFCNRDSAFLNFAKKNMDWSYHNYRDSNIYNYLPAMEEMAKKNIHAIRMGTKVTDQLHTQNTKIIDYPNSKFKSDFLDIYLGSKCYFFLCTESGMSAIPIAFNRPIVYVNWSLLGKMQRCPSVMTLIIPKKWYLVREKRLMKFKEILDLQFEQFARSEKLKELGIKLIENTPEEITDVVTEMNLRLNDNWTENEEDKNLQNIYWSQYRDQVIKTDAFKIGAIFLRKNKNLLNY